MYSGRKDKERAQMIERGASIFLLGSLVFIHPFEKVVKENAH